MAEYHRTKCLFLAKKDYREADQIFCAYTESFGKIEILGKAIRKIKSKLRAGTDIFFVSEIEFVDGKAFRTLTDSIALFKFKNIRKSPIKLRVAHKISETAAAIIKGQEKDAKIWAFFLESFDILNNCPKDIPQILLAYYYYFWNFISLSGYQADLYNCCDCQKELLPGNLCFDASSGGIRCQFCFDNSGAGRGRRFGGNEYVRRIRVSCETIKILRFLTRRDWSIIKRLKFESQNLNQLKEITDSYFNFVTGASSCN